MNPEPGIKESRSAIDKAKSYYEHNNWSIRLMSKRTGVSITVTNQTLRHDVTQDLTQRHTN